MHKLLMEGVNVLGRATCGGVNGKGCKAFINRVPEQAQLLKVLPGTARIH